MSRLSMALKLTAIASSIAVLSNSVGANQGGGYYQKKPEGWYWYDDPKAAEKPPEKPKPKEELKPKVIVMGEPKQPPKVVKPQEAPKVEKKDEPPKALSTAWLRDNYPKMQERAMDNPTNPDGSPSKDVIAFMYVQKLVLDKAQNFSTAAHQAAQLDPLLDEENRVPLSTSSVMMFNSFLEKDREEALNYLTKKAGLWFFFDSTCRYCVHQLAMLDRLKTKYDFSILNISVNNQPIKGMKQKWHPNKGHSKMLGLTMTPTVVLVVPPNNFYIISQGLSSVATLEKKILLAATVKNLLPKELKDRVNPYSKGVVTSDQMKKLEAVQADIDKDPTKIVDYIQKTLGHD